LEIARMSGCSESVSEIAEAIERYLAKHPEAADSVEGIGAWWLSPPGTSALPDILAALAQLEARGVVVRSERVGVGTIYCGALRGTGSRRH
jgi:hypothetical protein